MDTEVLDKIWESSSEIKIHFFGKFNRKLLSKYKPYSADASTWAKSVGFGRIYYWDPEDNKEYKINLGEREGSSSNDNYFDDFHHKQQFEEFLHNQFGYTRTQLMSDYIAKQIVNLYFFNKLSEIIDPSPN